MPSRRSTIIANLNDIVRHNLTNSPNSKIQLSHAVEALPQAHIEAILENVKTFSSFTPENDPYGEHDYGRFEFQPTNQEPIGIIWKIDYLDRNNLNNGAEDPSDDQSTLRRLTIMCINEW